MEIDHKSFSNAAGLEADTFCLQTRHHKSANKPLKLQMPIMNVSAVYTIRKMIHNKFQSFRSYELKSKTIVSLAGKERRA